MTNGDIIPGAMHVHAVFKDIREDKGDIETCNEISQFSQNITQQIST